MPSPRRRLAVIIAIRTFEAVERKTTVSSCVPLGHFKPAEENFSFLAKEKISETAGEEKLKRTLIIRANTLVIRHQEKGGLLINYIVKATTIKLKFSKKKR